MYVNVCMYVYEYTHTYYTYIEHIVITMNTFMENNINYTILK